MTEETQLHAQPEDRQEKAASHSSEKFYIGVIVGMLIPVLLFAAVVLVNARITSKALTILLLAASAYIGIKLNRMVTAIVLAAVSTAFGLMIV